MGGVFNCSNDSIIHVALVANVHDEAALTGHIGDFRQECFTNLACLHYRLDYICAYYIPVEGVVVRTFRTLA